MKKWLLCVLCTLFAGNSWAVIPENGWWWASNESGRGFNIEIQNNLLFLAAFAYDSGGNPIWLTSGGPMTSDRDYTGQLFRTSAGQCFGCAYVAPVVSAAGTVTLRFTSSQTAVLTVNGVAINVKRFDWWLNEAAPDAMLGEWSAVIGAARDIFDGERMDFTTKAVDSSGPYLQGIRLGSSSSTNPAIAQYDASRGQWTMLLDSSTSFYRLFIFTTTGFNRVEGNFWIYAKNASPTGTGTFYQAFRTASHALLVSGTGPGSSKEASEIDLRAYEERDARLAMKTKNDGPGLDAQTMAIVSRMQQVLERERR